jgi:uncharacterized membrane protein (DUF485 family)
MSETTAGDDGPGAAAAPGESIDWRRIESSEEFRELTHRRHRFLAAASLVSIGGFLAYLLLATFAHGFMGTRVLGGVPVAFLAAVSQVLLTWAVTWAYLRKADREFGPLEDRVLQVAEARFTRAPGGGAPERAARPAATTDGSTR